MTASPEGTHLEPCPFCGHKAFMAPPHEERPEWNIECSGYSKDPSLVDCPGPTIEHRDRDHAIALWNRRAPHPFTKEEREAIEYALKATDGCAAAYDLGDPEGDAFEKAAAILRAMLDSSKGGEK